MRKFTQNISLAPFFTVISMLQQATFTQLQQSIKAGKLANLYILHGEEGYFTDRIAELLENVLPEADRDFNQYIFYAPQTEPDTVIDACRRYPMMADRQMVIVKECQANGCGLPWLNKLLPYMENPNEVTTLVLVYRGAEIDAKSKFLKDVASAKINAEALLSKLLRGAGITTAIRNLVTSHNLNIEDKALSMLEQFVGSDLSRIYNEVEKMTVALPSGATVTPESIERYIGVSKDYNVFEFRTALAGRNAQAVFTMVNYFRSDPKNNPVPVIISTIFGLFSDMLIAIYTPDKSERGLMAALKVRFAIQVKDTMTALRNYKPWQVIQIIDAIRRADAMSKGNGSRQDPYAILHQLCFTILTCPGKSPV